MKNKIKVKEVTKDNFANYGQVIKEPSEKDWTSPSVDYWSNLGTIDFNQTEVEVNLGIAKSRSLEFTELERHNQSPEMLIPVGGEIIVPVATGEDASKKEAFLISKGEALIFKKGIWHSTPFPVENKCKFLVLYKRDTIPHDKNMINLENEYTLEMN
ncbi:MAG: ureidoglycolate lyase [Halanaerobiales bacterium]|nr:ureidoglycolate lyase [Halanaerobiales bacterium]